MAAIPLFLVTSHPTLGKHGRACIRSDSKGLGLRGLDLRRSDFVPHQGALHFLLPSLPFLTLAAHSHTNASEQKEGGLCSQLEMQGTAHSVSDPAQCGALALISLTSGACPGRCLSWCPLPPCKEVSDVHKQFQAGHGGTHL